MHKNREALPRTVKSLIVPSIHDTRSVRLSRMEIDGAHHDRSMTQDALKETEQEQRG